MSASPAISLQSARKGLSAVPRGILLAVDDSEASRLAFNFTLEHFCTGADQLIILHCYSIYPSGVVLFKSVEMEKKKRDDAEKLVNEFCRRAEEAKVICECKVREGDPREEILNVVEAFHPDLLVVGDRGPALMKGAFMGSVSQYCMREAKCPVMIVRKPKWAEKTGETSEPPRNKRAVVIAVDASEGSKYAFRWAMEKLLRKDNDSLVLVTALAFPAYLKMRELVSESVSARVVDEQLKATTQLLGGLSGEAKANGFECSTDIVQDTSDAREALVEATRKYQAVMLIMGSRGLDQVKRLLLGSVSEFCARQAECSVLVVRPEG